MWETASLAQALWGCGGGGAHSAGGSAFAGAVVHSSSGVGGATSRKVGAAREQRRPQRQQQQGKGGADRALRALRRPAASFAAPLAWWLLVVLPVALGIDSPWCSSFRGTGTTICAPCRPSTDVCMVRRWVPGARLATCGSWAGCVSSHVSPWDRSRMLGTRHGARSMHDCSA